MSTASILRALGALAPGRTKPAAVDPADLVWLGTTPARDGLPHDPLSPQGAPQTVTATFLSFPVGDTTAPAPEVHVVGVDGQLVPKGDGLLGELAARATLNGVSTVPVSWMTAVGWSTDPEVTEPVVVPVLQTSATLARRALDINSLLSTVDRSWALRRRTDWVPPPEVGERDGALELLDTIPWTGLVGHPSAGDSQLAQSPTLQRWLRDFAAVAGWRIAGVTGKHPQKVLYDLRSSRARRPGDVIICVGYAILPIAERTTSGSGAALAAWAERPGIDDTAFAALATDPAAAPDTPPPTTDRHHLTSHVPLTAAQRRLAVSARTAPVTVVSGAPGTGKTHTIAAICADAVARGESVLVGTRTIEAASVVAGLLARQPGPVPIRFGSPDALREAFAEIERRMAERDTPGTALAAEAEAGYVDAYDAVSGLLDQLTSVDRAADPGRVTIARQQVPGCFEPGADLDRVDQLLDRAEHAPGWLGTALGRSGRRTRAARELATLTGAACATPAQRAAVARAASVARGLRAGGDAPELASALGTLWPAFEEAESSRRYWTGRALDHLTLERLDSRAARAALTTIGTALRSGPTARQRLLGTIDRRAFRDAAPLWLGTLGEIERLLPPTAAWFDLVVIDEASQVDLALAAPALLRGARCVVLGDPRQLRHVSFVGDDAAVQAFEAEGVGDDIGRLDVRRNSVFDVAAGVAPVTWLDEHHRSLPHLVQFSLDEFYDRAVDLATRYPTSECRDCIDVVAPRNDDPVPTVVRRLRELHRSGATDVGVVTPFRELADRLQEAVLGDLGPDTIAAMHLMVTTVHGFQGAERAHMIVVPGVDATSPPGRRRFAEDPNLFNVMVSRARQHMDLVTDVEPDERSLLGRFVAWSHRPPSPTTGERPTHPSAIALGAALADAGLDVRYRYPVGGHRVDVVVRKGERVVGILCGVHPDGTDAHVDRHLALRATRWRLVDLVPPLDDAAIAARAIELAGDLNS